MDAMGRASFEVISLFCAHCAPSFLHAESMLAVRWATMTDHRAPRLIDGKSAGRPLHGARRELDLTTLVV